MRHYRHYSQRQERPYSGRFAATSGRDGLYTLYSGRRRSIQREKVDCPQRRLCERRAAFERTGRESVERTEGGKLLPVGVVRIEGEFEKDDIVKIIDHRGRQIGVGRIGFDSAEARALQGKHGQKPMVHYDYLYLD